MEKKVDKFEWRKKGTRRRLKGDKDKRLGLKIPQECIDFIVARIGEVKGNMQIAREVSEKFGLSHGGAYRRVQTVWQALSKEAGGDKQLERTKVGQALLKIYRHGIATMSLETVVAQFREHGIEEEQIWRVLAKWDPHRGAMVALKAIEQYTKLYGLAEPDQVEVKHEHGAAPDPLTMTPQERRDRIRELISKGEIDIKNTGNPRNVIN